MEENFWFPDDPWREDWNEEQAAAEKEKRACYYWSLSLNENISIIYGNSYEMRMYEDWISYLHKRTPLVILLKEKPLGARFLILSDVICDILSQEGAVYDYRHRLWRKRRNRLY